MSCLGTHAKRHAIARTRLGVTVGLCHEPCSVRQARVDIRPRSQVLQCLDLAPQVALRFQRQVLRPDSQPDFLSALQFLQRPGTTTLAPPARARVRDCSLTLLTSASRKFIFGAPMNPATKNVAGCW